VLAFGLQRMELHAIDIAQQSLEAQGAEQTATAHNLERLLDGRDQRLRRDGLRTKMALAVATSGSNL